jgi:hypothetical protein
MDRHNRPGGLTARYDPSKDIQAVLGLRLKPGGLARHMSFQFHAGPRRIFKGKTLVMPGSGWADTVRWSDISQIRCSIFSPYNLI